MPVTRDQLLAIFPGADGDWAGPINAALTKFGIASDNAVAAFLAIIGNETGGLKEPGRENMRYSVTRAKEVFSKARQHPDVTAQKLGQGVEAFANWIYAGVLGNGDEASGDGWRYRGGGIIQLTGRSNYRAFFSAAGLPLDTDPERLATDRAVSAEAAAWFMADYAKLLPKMDTGTEADFLAAARRVGIPPDARATARRLAIWRMAKAVLANDDAVLASNQPAAAPANPTARRATLAGSIAAFWTWVASAIDPADVPGWLGPAQDVVAFIWRNWPAVAFLFALAALGTALYDWRRARLQSAARKNG